MQIQLSPADEARALEILRIPRTAIQFAEDYFEDAADDEPGRKSRRGHAFLGAFVRSGKARRISEGGIDVFVAVPAPVTSPYARPAVSPELQVDPATGQVFERRAVGRLATSDQPEDDGELQVDPETGTVSRVVRQVIGQAQIPVSPEPPRPPYRYARPQAPPYAPPPVQQPVPAPQWRPTEQQFIDWSLGELETYAMLQDEERWEEAEHHWQVYLLGARRWNVALGWAQPNPAIDRRLEAAVEASQPRYRPRPNGSNGRPWAQPRRHPMARPSYGW